MRGRHGRCWRCCSSASWREGPSGKPPGAGLAGAAPLVPRWCRRRYILVLGSGSGADRRRIDQGAQESGTDVGLRRWSWGDKRSIA